jgi:transposase InsO family protein
VFRFSIREMLWLTLVVAVTVGWWTESYRARQWKQRAEIAAGQLEAENLGKMVFSDQGATFVSWQYDESIRETFFQTDPVW